MAGGFLLASTRAVGPYFVGAIALIVLLARGREVIDVLRRQTRLAVATAAVVVAGLGLNVLWEQRYQPHLDVTPAALGHWHWERLPSLGREMVGVFGWLEWHMPNRKLCLSVHPGGAVEYYKSDATGDDEDGQAAAADVPAQLV